MGDDIQVIATNRQASRRFELRDTYEAGLVLLGSEVKSLREAKYWPPVGRVDNVYGDRNLFCSCVPISDFA